MDKTNLFVEVVKMGTRSLTVVMDGKRHVMTLYRQFDGNPERHGEDLAALLGKVQIINGLGSGDSDRLGKVANGMGCLAAQLVARLKDCVGNVYVEGRWPKKDWKDTSYQYVINRGSYCGEPGGVVSRTVTVTVMESGKKVLFKGDGPAFAKWVNGKIKEQKKLVAARVE